MSLVVFNAEGIGPIALTQEDLAAALARAQELLRAVKPAPVAPSIDAPLLLDADQLETRTGIPASWWMAQAREHRVPHQRIGRRVRFDLAAVMASDAVRKREAV